MALWDFDLSTASESGDTKLFDTDKPRQCGAIAMSPDGTVLVALEGNTSYNSGYIHQYTLSTPNDLSTASYDGAYTLVDSNVGSTTNFYTSLRFKPDGTAFYVTASDKTTNVYEFSLTSAWDITSGVSYVGATGLTGMTCSFGLTISDDGNHLYTQDFNTIYHAPLVTSWDISSHGSVDSLSPSGTVWGFRRAMAVAGNGDSLLFIDSSDDRIAQVPMSTAWDISSAQTDGSDWTFFTISFPDGAGTGLAYSDGAEDLYYDGAAADIVRRLNHTPYSPIVSVASSISGSGSIDADLYLSANVGSSVSGSGTLSSTASMKRGLSSTVSGNGTLSSTLEIIKYLDVAFSGTGTLSPTASANSVLDSALSATGTLTSSVDVITYVHASVSGSGTLAIEAVIKRDLAARISGNGTFISAGDLTSVLKCVILGTSSLSSESIVRRIFPCKAATSLVETTNSSTIVSASNTSTITETVNTSTIYQDINSDTIICTNA